MEDIISYEEMLEEAYKQLPSEVFKRERLEVPKVACIIFGSRTFLENFKDICEILNRDPNHVLRYLLKELATSGSIEGSRAVFHGRFEGEVIDRLIRRYMDEFVNCPICKRPDTKIIKEKRLNFLVCEACGAKSPVRRI
ncbi:MAG: translation initiation factor IF-2 subunit beta [Candidatus Bathyarchaeia archaeon]|nr:translation initiation factor IF-2 subunit beta [Candidatus Bathyarchaeota archaeon]